MSDVINVSNELALIDDHDDIIIMKKRIDLKSEKLQLEQLSLGAKRLEVEHDKIEMEIQKKIRYIDMIEAQLKSLNKATNIKSSKDKK